VGRVVFTADPAGLLVAFVATLVAIGDGDDKFEGGVFFANVDNPRIRASGMRTKIVINFQLIRLLFNDPMPYKVLYISP
jgi:hypothetical protein